MKQLLVAAAVAMLSSQAEAGPAKPLPTSPAGCSPTHYDSELYVSPEWAKVWHSDFDYAWRWCEDTKLVVGLNNVSRPVHSFGMHVLYDGTTLGTTAAGGFNYLLLGLLRSDGTAPQVSLATSLQLALEGSDEHGCDTLGYDQLEVEVHASKVGFNIRFEIDVEGTAYMLFPGVGTLWTRDVGSLFYAAHDVVSWLTGIILWPTDLDKAVHSGSSLGTLRFDAHTSMPGMHFQKHNGTFPFLEVDLDHVCEQDPLPSKPEFTYSMTIMTGDGGDLPMSYAAKSEHYAAE